MNTRKDVALFHEPVPLCNGHRDLPLPKGEGRAFAAPKRLRPRRRGKGELRVRITNRSRPHQLFMVREISLATATVLHSALFSLLLFILCGCSKTEQKGEAKAATKQITVAMMPKSKGNAYFISCKKGADQAAQELGIKLIW